jgi:hypothetical protein
MRVAFKEWSIVVDALGRGEQIMILRKGGISEGKGGFKLEHNEFLLFPTLFHQQRESVIARAQERYDQIAPGFPKPDQVVIEYFARVESYVKVNSLQAAKALEGQHIWKDEVIAERFNWGREESISAIAVRVLRLAEAFVGPMLPDYGGCKSWITLADEIDTEGATPVLPDEAFAEKLARMKSSLGAD